MKMSYEEQKKKQVKIACNERREKSIQMHSSAVETSKDILSDVLVQARDVSHDIYLNSSY